MTNNCATRWLTLLCSMIPGVRTAAYVNSLGEDGGPDYLAIHPASSHVGAELDALISTTLSSREITSATSDAQNDSPSLWRLAHPIAANGGNAVVGLELANLSEDQHPAILQLVAWAGQWATLVDQEPSRTDPTPGLSLTTALLGATTLEQTLSAACRHLATDTGCERVAIGLIKKNSVVLASISNRRTFEQRAEAVAHLAVAMNEAFDQSTSVVYPTVDDQTSAVTLGHQQLAHAQQAAVCTVPLGDPSSPVGMVTFLRAEQQPFDRAQLERLQPTLELIAGVIRTRLRAEQPLVARAAAALRRWRDEWLLATALRRRAAVAAAAALVAFAVFGSATHQVSAPALLAGISERTLASPVDGYLSEVYVRAGARVAKGDVLASLDPKPLERQRRQLQGQQSQLSGEYSVALGNLDGASARILQSQLAQTNVQIEHLDEQIARLEITAPYDGLILDGDLMHATGGPVALGDALFRLTPDEGYVVRLHVDEGDVATLGVGARGRLKLAALPNAELGIEVIRINGVAQTLDGRSVLEMEATVEGDQSYLRPGMKGVARLDAGRAGVLWIWTHSFIQRLKLWFWQFSPVA